MRSKSESLWATILAPISHRLHQCNRTPIPRSIPASISLPEFIHLFIPGNPYSILVSYNSLSLFGLYSEHGWDSDGYLFRYI